MKIFINLPTWLGDAVMASAAIYAIREKFKNAEFIFYGSFTSTELFKRLPNSKIIVENKKQRYTQILKLRPQLGFFNLAFSFRSAFSSKIILNLIKTQKRFYFDKNILKEKHQVLKYLNFIENALEFKASSQKLQLPIQAKKNKKILGINPGAHFGSAKRWKSEYFYEVAKEFATTHSIIIFGVKSEELICQNIENLFVKNGIKVKNLCGKTSIFTLCKNISMLDILITNDSGPMHIGAVYGTKTLAIFGPTKFKQTSPWQQNAKIVHLNLPCMPCMKKVCPLKHHACMEDLKPDMVISLVKKLIGD
ncbi:lipopolysaccharide heptosyltransferase II [Campylobacter insulaenigrae]|uniref:lipopolysaccharide heptosyltransferase II n=1 Tax=Campylobacter insulaenigrae TaxID=260714 RepID=UPI000F6D4AD4|nr:lipopolysaccharide heptosyltransferase II [Campylobacter insulaenigrae]MCR6591845.1 lipopolysaccharide heptosyltransferase II [Campylobacter insulaenigrae]MCR6593330.1 lipopolysaccharide heptosyltransferase II [Campylobacter insulaenigrae]VEJ54917.1 lipopolysaccharide heptosyltransferase II [Campylobacter insulaenigrae]